MVVYGILRQLLFTSIVVFSLSVLIFEKVDSHLVLVA